MSDGSTESRYWFVKNLQGDVTGILDSSDTLVAEYKYDAWGKILSSNTLSTTGLNSVISTLNPFRYRGYMYDEESGFYYLRSRYYDPAVGRFLNADGLVSTGTGILGYNMFAYCNNNPVMCVDYLGYCPGTVEHIRACCAGLITCDSGYYHNAREAWANKSIQSFLDKSRQKDDSLTMDEKELFVNLIYFRARIGEPRTGIPAELMTAQACYESGYGGSDLARNDNNIFGLSGFSFTHVGECLAYYETWISGKTTSLTGISTDIYLHLQGGSLDDWIKGIGPAGYCSEPSYADGLYSVIQFWDIGGIQ